MGQGVRLTTGEASSSSSMEWASFESRSPLDPSLIVIGSPTPQIREARGAPSCSRGRGTSPRLGDGGAVSPTNRRGGALSTPVGGRGSEEPVSTRKRTDSR